MPWREGRNAELLVRGDGADLRIQIEASDWKHRARHEVWSLPIEFHVPLGAKSSRLTTSRGEVSPVSAEEVAEGSSGFMLLKDSLVARDGEGPPGEATLTLHALDFSAGRIEQGHLSGRGATVLPGSSSGCRIDIPPGNALRFGTVAQPLLGPRTEGDPCIFRVLLDGELVYEHREPLETSASCDWHSVPLPEAGRPGAWLEFEVTGPFAITSILDPMLGPREIGSRAARPWNDARPDVVLFLADTFRADNLRMYGGESGVAPHLDELASRSLCFTRAWSTASWTLPAHASILAGYYPGQVLGAGVGNKLPEEVDTIAEKLARSGYRTGAVTDGGFVSARFGLDQGFDYFAECSGDLGAVLAQARAFLDADDGRPTFLFVQTYRVHGPYQVSEQSRRELGERLDLREADSNLFRSFVRRLRRGDAGEYVASHELEDSARTTELLAMARRLYAQYLGGVADLDREFQGFLEYLENAGVLDGGYLVFTSDHGEAFLEHDAAFHGHIPYEEQARVPLFIAGRGLVGQRVETAVSLVDLAPTLAQMAGIPGTAGWPGSSLLEPRPNRALFGFQFAEGAGDALFVLEGTQKMLLRRDDEGNTEVLGLYELAEDAREEHDLAAESPDSIREILERHISTVDDLLTPLVQSERAELDADKAEELRALGY